MSEFYGSLVRWYDLLFPEEPAISLFLLKGLPASATVLDLGCGTGTYAAAVARAGHRVTAVDPSAEMIARAADRNAGMTVAEGTLTRFPRGPYRLISCIGNTLPHLQSYEEVARALSLVEKSLEPDGELVLQTVNFDGQIRFPVIAKEQVRMDRWYTPGQDPDHVQFHIRISQGEEHWESETPLLVLKTTRLLELMKEAGLDCLELLGSYSGENHGEDSFLTVIRGGRQRVTQP